MRQENYQEIIEIGRQKRKKAQDELLKSWVERLRVCPDIPLPNLFPQSEACAAAPLQARETAPKMRESALVSRESPAREEIFS